MISVQKKTCLNCLQEKPMDDFMRRTGQTYFVAPDGRSWPQEPLLPKVEEDTCRMCFVLEALQPERTT